MKILMNIFFSSFYFFRIRKKFITPYIISSNSQWIIFFSNNNFERSFIFCELNYTNMYKIIKILPSPLLIKIESDFLESEHGSQESFFLSEIKTAYKIFLIFESHYYKSLETEIDFIKKNKYFFC